MTHRQQVRAARADKCNLQQQRRGSLRLEKDSLGRSNVNKRGPKSKDEGCVRFGTASPAQSMFARLCREGVDPAEARVQAGL